MLTDFAGGCDQAHCKQILKWAAARLSERCRQEQAEIFRNQDASTGMAKACIRAAAGRHTSKNASKSGGLIQALFLVSLL